LVYFSCLFGTLGVYFGRNIIMKYAIPQANGPGITKGKKYKLTKPSNGNTFDAVDDNGIWIYSFIKESLHLNGRANWTIIDMKTTQEEIDELRLEQIEQNESFANSQAKQDKKIARLEEKLKEKQGPLLIPQAGDTFTRLEFGMCGFGVKTVTRAGYSRDFPCFREESTAQGFAEAINIKLEWYMCEGVVEPKQESQFIVDYGMHVVQTCHREWKISLKSPAFDTEANAKASIEKIGRDRIMAYRRGDSLMG